MDRRLRELRANKLLEPTKEGQLRTSCRQAEEIATKPIADARPRGEMMLHLPCEMHCRT